MSVHPVFNEILDSFTKGYKSCEECKKIISNREFLRNSRVCDYCKERSKLCPTMKLKYSKN